MIKVSQSINNIINNNSKCNKQIVEKYIFALYLLERISLLSNEFPFVFKGGTSLCLYLKKIERFSIDIDINLKETIYKNKEHLIKSLNNIKGEFIKVEESIRKTKSSLKCLHFKFFYNSIYDKNESYILLDIVFQDYSFESNKLQLINKYIEQDRSPININVISINDLLADKLTAFAPNTIGIKYTSKTHNNERPKIVEIIKQIFDINLLINKYNDIDSVALTYKNIANLQIKYRNINLNYIKCLDDTISTCEDIVLGKNPLWNLYISYLNEFNEYLINNKLLPYDLKKMSAKIWITCLKIKEKFTKLKKISKIDYYINKGITSNNSKNEFELIFDDNFEEFSKYMFI